MNFYELLTKLCYSRGISPSKLCSEIGLSNATATQWKKGAKPSAKSLELIAKYFEMSTVELAERLKVIDTIWAVEKLKIEAEIELSENKEAVKQQYQIIELIEAYTVAPENIKKAINTLLEIDVNIRPINEIMK